MSDGAVYESSRRTLICLIHKDTCLDVNLQTFSDKKMIK